MPTSHHHHHHNDDGDSDHEPLSNLTVILISLFIILFFLPTLYFRFKLFNKKASN